MVRTCFLIGQESWYAGAELYGESVFVDSLAQETLWHGDEGEPWLREFQRLGNQHFHPCFVWWHTLSHRLISALSIDSGYSAASIRERIYLKVKGDHMAAGGLLLYAAQQGSDGSLGGLIALVPRFQQVLNAALRNIDACSNDPLCSENVFVSGKINGAACYACQFVSGTSCEFQNSYLDRNLLRRNS